MDAKSRLPELWRDRQLSIGQIAQRLNVKQAQVQAWISELQLVSRDEWDTLAPPPTQEEIAIRAAEVRAGWDDITRERRTVGRVRSEATCDIRQYSWNGGRFEII